MNAHNRQRSTLIRGSPAWGGYRSAARRDLSFYKLVQQVAEARVLSQTSPCEICGGQSGTRTPFSPRNSVLPCQYRSINPPYSSCSSNLLNRRTSGRELSKKRMYLNIAPVLKGSALHTVISSNKMLLHIWTNLFSFKAHSILNDHQAILWLRLHQFVHTLC